MTIPFFKYQGAGNDFVIIDQRNQQYIDESQTDLIHFLCDRRFGVGGDGLMFIETSEKADFKMNYFNADGRQSSMCGNGGRCIVSLAHHLGIVGEHCVFDAIDGLHEASMLAGHDVALKMIDVDSVSKEDEDYVLDTGSPHFIRLCPNLNELDLTLAAHEIRYGARYKEEGINVNFIEPTEDGIAIRTYERGVEDETLACGTGVTAAAIAWAVKNEHFGQQSYQVQAAGGALSVKFDRHKDSFKEVWLTGPATLVFQGEIEVKADQEG